MLLKLGHTQYKVVVLEALLPKVHQVPALHLCPLLGRRRISMLKLYHSMQVQLHLRMAPLVPIFWMVALLLPQHMSIPGRLQKM